MNKVYFKRNPAAFRELMKSTEMQNVLMEYGNAMQLRAGKGYEVHQMGTRAIAVLAATDEAIQDNYNNNTLLKARGGAI